uniref:Uncharacterized protein n=1 Tax=Oryza glumipatula TaxID=40148 RepID=A0A0E0AW55_9ORYZ
MDLGASPITTCDKGRNTATIDAATTILLFANPPCCCMERQKDSLETNPVTTTTNNMWAMMSKSSRLQKWKLQKPRTLKSKARLKMGHIHRWGWGACRGSIPSSSCRTYQPLQAATQPN